MKVLWFSPTASLYENKKVFYHGGGWIESLEEMIQKDTDMELGICFFHATDKTKQKKDKVTYYPIPLIKEKKIRRTFNRLMNRPESEMNKNTFLRVIDDFNPDLIHIWGTESPFAQILPSTQKPTILYIQGLMSGCSIACYPPGIGKLQFLFSADYLKDNILRRSPGFVKKFFDKEGENEVAYFKHSKYIVGRTNWDKIASSILAPHATYFHVDEILRNVFYRDEKRLFTKKNKVIIVSTLSDNTYKGIDVIFKTAKLLKEHTSLIFEWQIIGLSAHDKLVLFIENQLKIKSKNYNINFLGIKTGEELAELLKNADTYVHPSYIDNSPNSLCEAQIFGVPVIACNVGGISTLVENNVTGILVPANAPYELVNSIIELTSKDELASRLGTQGRQAALKRHDRDKILADTISVYKTVLNK